jgi:ribonuclease P protein component
MIVVWPRAFRPGASRHMRTDYRLRENTDFQRVRREGRTWTHPLLVMSALPNHREHSRFGFAVGRRIGKAVVRNRLKRRMREAVRARVQKGEAASGWDVVLVARRPARDASYQRIEEALDQLFYSAGFSGAAQ